MKIKKIAAICKAAKSIVIYEKENLQYLGTGMAVYPMYGLAPLDTESVFIIFDLAEKQKEEYICIKEPLPTGINFEDYADCENMVIPVDLRITYNGRVLMPMQTSRGIIFIDSTYLEPIAGESELMELYERFTDKGQQYIVAKAGFMLLAVIMPYQCISKPFCEVLTKLAEDCEIALLMGDARKAAQETAPNKTAMP